MHLNFFAKLVLLVLTLTLAATGITGIILLNGMESSQKANIDQQLQAQAGSFAQSIDAVIAEKIKTGQLIAGHPQVIQGNEMGIKELLAAVYKNDSNAYESLSFTNKQGIITYIVPDAAAAKMTGVSVVDRQYFKDTMQHGKPVISQVLVSRDSGMPIIIITAPIKDSAGNFAGMVCQTVRLNALETLRAQVKIGNTGYALVAANQGGKAVAIAHPEKNFVTEQKDLTDLSIIKATMGGEKQLASFRSQQGAAVIGATDFVKSTGWIVTALVEEQEVYEPMISGRYKMLGIIAATVLIVLLLTWYFARRIANRLTVMVRGVTQVAQGDLRISNVRDDSADEIGKLDTAIRAMTENLSAMIKHVARSSEQVAATSQELTASTEQSAQAAGQVAESITEIAHGSENQLLAVTETSTVTQQMLSSIQQVVSNVNLVTVKSNEAARTAKDGGKSVDKAVSQMNQIEQTVNSSAGVVAKLGDRSKEIGQIVDTISGIAGQTNLLALNAAIEAARAGEQGRGFAVVAEEVRGLAEQSQEAAKQIAVLIGEIQKDTDAAVVAMNDGTREVKIGAEVVHAAGNSFSEIVEMVTQVSGQVQEIATAIQEMANGSKQIVSSVEGIERLSKQVSGETETVSAATEEQSASMEEISAASRNLAGLAEELQTAVSKFHL